MDPLHCAQVAVPCRRCMIAVPSEPLMCCDNCHIHLCKTCKEEHLCDEIGKHKVESFKKREFLPQCSKHFTKLSVLYCERCDIPICTDCVSSGEHLGHKQIDIWKSLETKKEVLQKDLEELEKSIFPTYQEIVNNISDQKVDLDQNSQKLTTAIDRHGEDMHREVNLIIKNLKSKLDDMNSDLLVALNQQDDEISRTVAELQKSIAYLNELLNSNDVSKVFAYRSRIAKFRNVPPKPIVSLPSFTPYKINNEQIYQHFGFLSASSITTEVHDYPLIPPTSKDKPLTDVPKIITNINTKFGDSNLLGNVSCLSDEEIWVSGQGKIMRLYNLKGKMLKEIETKSRHTPNDIAVSKDGYLFYVDYNDRTVNKVYTDHNDRAVNVFKKNAKIQEVVSLPSSRPYNVCSTSSGDLLVVMVSEDKQTKVVRYSCSGSEIQKPIQFDDKGESLYSSGFYSKSISENRNKDICVADSYANAVVVVSEAGKFRYNYTGPPSTPKGSFAPIGIITDSQSRILTSDNNNFCIHIIDQDGQFLRYIDNCNLDRPCGLCVDTSDNLFVVEYTGDVKKIQYCR